MNEPTKLTDKHFIDWESHYLGAGYGTGEEHVFTAFHVFFCSLKGPNGSYDHTVLEKELGPIAAWFLINFLVQANLVDYGTSSRHGWLTLKGRLLREYMMDKSIEDLCRIIDSAYGTGVDYIYCFPDCCQCETPCNNPMFFKETA